MIKLKHILTEKKELGGALINKIERFTDRNYHTEARMELAKAVGDKKLVEAYKAIGVVHMYLKDMNDLCFIFKWILTSQNYLIKKSLVFV